MSKKMLIDAGHPEETRVVVTDGSKVEDFDFEAAARKPIRGNIYLAKVTRVEPSLQAAFVEYGGNRHGFLAFNEIHPDYYQIPFEDRQALAEEEESAAAEDAAEEEAADAKAESASDEDTTDVEAEASDGEDGETAEAAADSADDSSDEDAAETIDGDDEDEIDDAKASRMRRQLYRRYKIQEVIKRRQVLLVQVAKEERGNKGAALTTYLSLAGRYCVLMPNTPRGGGISRKISNVSDRKRLKSVVNDLELPKGVGLIIRTAGAKRTKTEIRRDADYLMRLWENIREMTLKSVAPALIYEEGNLVKRAIRDLYDKEIDEVLVEGEAAYKEAKAFMRLLMPSHAKKVQHFKDQAPLFLRYQVESQLEAIYSPVAPLKSGGYLVINPTEALVSIDVNSGRSTRERNIEATALKTNLEAATEAARQMRLRDLAGLVVIDFIDMDESKNNRAVEKRMKEVLKRDRARLQMGRISQFGLMELSRQRRRASIIEGSTTTCPSCQGTGHIRSVESSALVALRGLEKEGMRGRTKRIRISVPTAIALYLLNDKRDHLLSIEERFSMHIAVSANDQLIAPNFTIEALESREPGEQVAVAPLSVESIEEIDTSDMPDPEETQDEPREGGRRRRRRRRRRGSGSGNEEAAAAATGEESETSEGEEAEAGEDSTEGSEDAPRRRRRRGRRGGRGRRRGEARTETAEGEENAEAETVEADAEDAPAESVDAETPDADAAEDKPKRRRSRRRKKSDDAETDADASAESEADSDAKPAEADAVEAEAEAEEKPKRRARRPRKKAEPVAEEASETAADTAEADAEEKPAAKPKRKPRKKKAESEEAPAEAAETTEAAEEKPATEKKKPARRRKTPAKKADTAEAAPEPETVAETAVEDDDKPKRRGWWNRTGGLFGK